MMRLCVCLLLTAWLTAAPAHAQQSEADALIAAVEKSYEPYDWGKTRPWGPYPAAPAREALGDDLYGEYVEALERDDCETAENLVKLAYLNRYPNIAPAFQNRQVKDDWSISIFQNIYPEAALCVTLANLRHEVARLQAEDYPVPPARSFLLATRNEDNMLFMRDKYARVVEALVRADYAPAMQAYLRLEDDDIVALDAKDRLHLLYRLEWLGQPLPDQQARVESATRFMLPTDIRNISCWAETNILMPDRLNAPCPF